MSTVLDGLRRPEYTGDRRCWPCTILNLVLLGAACLVLALWRWPVAAVVALVGCLVVAVRGYFVPYTPRFGPTLAPYFPGDFGHDDRRDVADGIVGDDGPGGEEILQTLVEAGVIVPDGERLELHERFHEDWWDEIERLRAAPDETFAEAGLAASPTADRAVVEREDGDEYLVLADADGSLAGGTWLARPVALADVASVGVLTEAGLEREVAVAAAEPLRTFLDRCPACETALDETTADNCCGGPTNPRLGPEDILYCEACDRRLYTFPHETAETADE